MSKTPSRRYELVELLIKAGVIRLPKTISPGTLRRLERLGLTKDKEKLRRRLLSQHYERDSDEDSSLLCERGFGEASLAETCWYLVYGSDADDPD